MYLCNFIQSITNNFALHIDSVFLSSWKCLLNGHNECARVGNCSGCIHYQAQREREGKDEGNITQSLSKYIFMCINYHAELMLLSNYLRCASMCASSHNVNHLMLCSPTSLNFWFSLASFRRWIEMSKTVKCKMTADAVKWK